MTTQLRNRKRWLAPLFAVLTLIGLLVGGYKLASGSSAGAGTAPQRNCLTAPGQSAKGAPLIAVLTGITADDDSSSLAADRQGALQNVLMAGFSMQARMLVDAIGSSPNPADFVVNTQLKPTGPNPLFVQSNLACKENGIKNAFANLERNVTSGPANVLGALLTLQDHLTGLSSKTTDVVLLSNMLNAVPPADLTSTRVLSMDHDLLIDAIEHAGLLPDCHGWNVYIIGGGVTPHQLIGDAADARIKAFWSDFFSRCGGRLVLFDDQLAQFPLQPSSIPPVPELKGKKRVIGGTTEVVVTLPDSVLFWSGSAKLLAAAAPVLDQLLPILTVQHPVGTIEITGYTDSVPISIPGGNGALSKARAVAVADWLKAHGVAADRIEPFGLGAADPVATNATPAGRQQNRRVEVAVVINKPGS